MRSKDNTVEKCPVLRLSVEREVPLAFHYLLVQWDLSMKDTLIKGHLSNEDTACSPNQYNSTSK